MNRMEQYDRILDNVIGELIAEPGKHTIRSGQRREEIIDIKAEVHGGTMRRYANEGQGNTWDNTHGIVG